MLLENHWYGAYNTLLQYHFPWEKAFQIMPQQSVPSLISPTPGMINFTTMYVVEMDFHPIFFVEVKVAAAFMKKSWRGGADDQMQSRFRNLQDDVILPKLYGISALGTRFSVYTFDENTREVTPPPLDKVGVILYDYAPASRWEYNLMEPAGCAKFAALVETTKKMCADVHKRGLKKPA
jgi:hypothetical protein